MPIRDPSGIGERVPRELLHADFEVAFSLVQMARDSGNLKISGELLNKAEGMLADIRARLLKLTPAQREPFEARCDELAKALADALAQAVNDELET
jgi:hypothetical protein